MRSQRVVAAVVAFGALAVLLAAALTAAVPPARSFTTPAPIAALGFDGTLVAYAANGAACGIHARDVRNGRRWTLPTSTTCELARTSTGLGITHVVVGGTRIAWVVNSGGNTESGDTVFTATLARRQERRVTLAVRTGDVDAGLAGRRLTNIAADGTLFAFAVERTEFVHPGACPPQDGGPADPCATRLRAAEIWSFDGSLPPQLVTKSPSRLFLAAVGGGRVVELRNDGALDVVDSIGSPLATAHPRSVKTVALDGPNLAVLQRDGSFALFDARTGALRWTLSTPNVPYTTVDVAAPIGLYVAGSELHVTDVRLGNDAVLATSRTPFVAARIEASGVVWATNARGHGIVHFVPHARVLAALNE